ncbi:MAG: DUF3703 domain-containing protein [Pseudobdellovibrio sp.]
MEAFHLNLLRTQYADRLVLRAVVEIRNRNYEVAWELLEEAHVFAQPDSKSHFYVHWNMLWLAQKTKDKREVWGQFVRLLLSIPSSVLRKYPEGNNGRSNIGLFTPMKLSQRNEKKLDKLNRLEAQRREEEKRHLTVVQRPPRLQINNVKAKRKN